MCFAFMNSVYLIYLVSYRPMIEQYNFDVFNEFCAILITLVSFAFTNVSDEVDISYFVGGYGFIGLFSFNVAVNFTYILGQTLRTAFLQLRYKLRVLIYKIKHHQKLKYH
jgi:hypothetical protein